MSDNGRILVLEGPLSQGIVDVLVEKGYPVNRAADAVQLRSEAGGAPLVVLDALAPGMSLAACRQLEQSIEAPVLVIVPALDTDHEVRSIQAPFTQDTLLDQVQELLVPPHDVVTVGELVIDLAAWRVALRGRPVDLSPMEFRLMAYLARNVGRTVTHEELLEEVWECSPELGDRHLVTSCVYTVRQKLGEDAGRPEYIVSAPGMEIHQRRGYKELKMSFGTHTDWRRHVWSQRKITLHGKVETLQELKRRVEVAAGHVGEHRMGSQHAAVLYLDCADYTVAADIISSTVHV